MSEAIATPSVVETRLVKVFDGSVLKKFQIGAASTIAEVKKLLIEAGCRTDFKNKLLVVKSPTFSNVEVNDGSVLPEMEPMTIHVFVEKTKSGISRKEIVQEIKTAKANFPDEAKAHFGNYTNKSTEELTNLLAQWKRKNKPASKKEVKIGLNPVLPTKPETVVPVEVPSMPIEEAKEMLRAALAFMGAGDDDIAAFYAEYPKYMPLKIERVLTPEEIAKKEEEEELRAAMKDHGCMKPKNAR